MSYVFVAVAAVGLGWVAGMWTRRLADRWCPRDGCGRTLRCPVHEAKQIGVEQRASGLLPSAFAS